MPSHYGDGTEPQEAQIQSTPNVAEGAKLLGPLVVYKFARACGGDGAHRSGYAEQPVHAFGVGPDWMHETCIRKASNADHGTPRRTKIYV
eukprot:2046034-Amphidinium_carterae.1